MVTVECKNCNKEFKTYKAWIKKGAGLHCSRVCAAQNMPKKGKTYIDKTCDTCSKDFKIRKGYGGTGTFCSRPCLAIWMGKNFNGSNHPNWKGGISKRTHASRRAIAIKKKLITACEKCSSINNLQGNHILPYSIYPELSADINNIEILCSICHAEKHPQWANMISIPRIRSGAYLNCVICTQSYYVRPYKIKKSKACSRKCSSKYAKTFRKGFNNERSKEGLDQGSHL